MMGAFPGNILRHTMGTLAFVCGEYFLKGLILIEVGGFTFLCAFVKFSASKPGSAVNDEIKFSGKVSSFISVSKIINLLNGYPASSGLYFQHFNSG